MKKFDPLSANLSDEAVVGGRDDLSCDDGREVQAALDLACDVAVVGSGPAGATVARALARSGARVVVLEEGPHVRRADFPEDGFSAHALLYRDLGASITAGRAPLPYVQGRAVGGTSVMNGAISWRLPRDVHAGWVAADPALGDALPWSAVEGALDEVERDLHIAPTEPGVAGRKNPLMAAGAAALGIEHRPTFRNVDGCQGLGRCLQGCPIGAKMSMDRTYLPDAAAAGASILASVRVEAVETDGGRATGVVAAAAGGGRIRVRARRAVVLAASAVGTPLLLLRSGIRAGPVGDRFQCHPGVSVTGRFRDPVRTWAGATQGHEAIGLRADGIKLEVLGFDMAIAATRASGIGSDLARSLDDLARTATFGAAIKAQALGRVRPAPWGGARVAYDLSRRDLARVRRAVRVMGEMLLAAGAESVCPGVFGWHQRVSDRATMARFEAEGPLDARAYQLAATHLFGTCRMGSDPGRSVVRPDFRHHAVDRLYVADSSVFPTNTGVNPQTSIVALAALCAGRIL